GAGSDREAVITGFGALTPVGNGAPASWRALLEGRSGIAEITAFDHTRLQVHIAAEVKDFDAGFLATKVRRRTARFAQMTVAAAREAVADAGLTLGED